MADPRVFTSFNFRVEISVPDLSDEVCAAAFAECDGLEMTMETKLVREGGNNARLFHLAGPVSYGQLTLKRGMSSDFGLWRWFTEVMKTEQRGLRGQASVVMLAADGSPQVTFTLTDCLPVKLKAPALNARDGVVAIEELQLVYAALDFAPAGGAGGFGISLGVGIGGGGIGVSAGVSFG